MTTLCLDNHSHSLWQLIDRSVQGILASLSPEVDQNLLQLISVWSLCDVTPSATTLSTLNNSRDLDHLDCSAASFLVQ